MTGSACAEGLAALIVGIIAGTTWAIIARRRRLGRYSTFFAGLLFLAVVVGICGLVGRSLAAGIIFRAAFNQSPSSAVTFVQTQRFGMMDNTGVVVMKTDKATLDQLLNDAGFKRCEKAEERLKDDPSAGIARDERQFRHEASVGGIFGDVLPFHPDLTVYEKTVKSSQSDNPAYIVRVTWDPRQDLAYVYVAYF